jgi:hypothetical protein
MSLLTPIAAKWAGKCACCATPFRAGDHVLHDAGRRRCYIPGHQPEDAQVFEQASSPQYREGLTAGCAAELVACPYQPDTAEAAAWMAGVRAARL